ncbi:hypothetical protein Lal_00010923 [Lupinus albus]|nr:hypothetical protein Lal_00010923 [Lupinus albus]
MHRWPYILCALVKDTKFRLMEEQACLTEQKVNVKIERGEEFKNRLKCVPLIRNRGYPSMYRDAEEHRRCHDLTQLLVPHLQMV